MLALEVFEIEISLRIAYIEAMLSGVSVMQYSPSSAAAEEIENFCKELIREGKRVQERRR